MKNIYLLRRAGAWRSYLGGAMLNSFWGYDKRKDSHYPEEWILSTVVARNAGRPGTDMQEGLSILKDSDLSFRDLLASEPERLLGQEHVRKFGCSPGILVKLIDSAERLTIQVHPDRKAAKKLFRSQFGKTECWHILAGREIDGETPCIYLGFKPGVTRAYWKKLFADQNIAEMLNCLHRFEVESGDTFLIEGGVPHSIGAGCFLVEIQEPTDYTIRTERTTPSGLPIPEAGCHQGLGFDRMFECFHYDGMAREDIRTRWKLEKRGDELIGIERSGCFELGKKVIDDFCEIPVNGRFKGIFILDGSGVVSDGSDCYNIARGDQLFIAASSTTVRLEATKQMQILFFGGPK